MDAWIKQLEHFAQTLHLLANLISALAAFAKHHQREDTAREVGSDELAG